MVLINHFTDEFDATYFGGEIGFNGGGEALNVQIYLSTGLAFGAGDSVYYVGPGFSFSAPISPQVFIGADAKYAYIPDYEDGFGGIYLTIGYKL